MKALDYLKFQIKSMRSLQTSVLEDMNDEMLAHKPLGTASSIGVIWLHMIAGEEEFLSIISGEKALWETEGWNVKFRLEGAPNMGEDWLAYEDAEISCELLKSYTSSVSSRTQSYLDTLEDGSLDETVKFFTEEDPKARVWALLISHTLIHAGEIAAIKGVSGGRGLPF